MGFNSGFKGLKSYQKFCSEFVDTGST